MPLQNRVDPHGVIFRTPARGTFMGNRGGALHNEDREIVRPFLNRRWITCVLEFRGRHRNVMTPGRYTELFFLDEAVSFAAGHRPCAECRRERYSAFKDAWKRSRGIPAARFVGADEMDAEMHRARVDANRRQVTYRARVDSLPTGCFVEIQGDPYLVLEDALLLWTPAQYANRIPRPHDQSVTVLTPRPLVECFQRGYVPEVHPSARRV
jgi:hypothetical protein